MASGRGASPPRTENGVERDANYTAVGAFVILVVAMAGLFVYWYADSREAREYKRYEIYFQGSVSGLSIGGPVRYLGVDVGRIYRIRVDRRSSDRVQVIADIDAEAPISEQTLAQLSLQGVTGLLFIDLEKSENRRDAMPPVPSERYPVINSVRSDFDELLATLPDVAGRARELIARMQDLFSPQNTEAVAQTLISVQEASRRMPETLDQVNALLAELRNTTGEMRMTAATLSSTTTRIAPEVIEAVERLRATADNIAKTTEGVTRLVEENRGGINAFTRDSLPEFERMVREARSAAEDVRELSRSLKDDPSRVLYQPNYRGVEIAP
jgi:phospholipid/cholesterol/gamma-HCH transport system substrate-binding protein